MPSDPLSITFAALADPTRRAILARLADGQATVSELAAPFDKSLPAISKHLRVLREAGLIEQGRNAQRRPCRLQAAPLQGVDHWLDRYRQIWEERYERLDDYLTTLQSRPEAASTTRGPTQARGPHGTGEEGA
jgi:DNA-binding transcriptional ArsR family regulator